MKALETCGYQDAKSLHQAALDRFGSEAEVAHQLRLEARRRRYAATTPGPRRFPCRSVNWSTVDYIREFEAANHLKPINGETASTHPCKIASRPPRPRPTRSDQGLLDREGTGPGRWRGPPVAARC